MALRVIRWDMWNDWDLVQEMKEMTNNERAIKIRDCEESVCREIEQLFLGKFYSKYQWCF